MVRRSRSARQAALTRTKLRCAAAAAAGAAALTACGDGADSTASGGEAAGSVRLGAILPLTGATAQSGNNSLEGIELAVDQINAAGGIDCFGGTEIELDVADATSDPARAASAATQFLTRGEPPLAIVGAYASGLTTTVARVSERRQVPLLTTSFSDELTAQGYKYLFQIPAPASEVGQAQMQYAVEIAEQAGQPIERAAIVYANNAYGESQAVGLREQADELGIEVVLYEGYSPTISDLTPVAQKVLGSQPDAIFSVAYVNDGVLMMRALNSQNNTVPVVGGVGGYITPDFQKSLGDAVDGVLSVDTSDPGQYGELGEAYQAEYGEFMPQEAHDNAAAVYVFAQALEQNCTTDPQELASTLREGVFDLGAAGSMPGGKVEFEETGANVHAEPLMVQWQEGELVGVWPQEITEHEPVWGAQ